MGKIVRTILMDPMKIIRKILILFVLGIISVSFFPGFGRTQAFSERTREERLVDGFLDRSDGDEFKKYHRNIFHLGDEMIPPLLLRFEKELNNAKAELVSRVVYHIAEALILLGDGGPDEMLDLLFAYPHLRWLGGVKINFCYHTENVTDTRCKAFVEKKRIPNVLANRAEFLPFLEESIVLLKEKMAQRKPPQPLYVDRFIYTDQSALDWLKRGGPKFTQPAGMSDEEAIRQLIIEFLATFEHFTPWLILEETEKGKPVKPGHRVSYFQRDKGVKPLTHEYYIPRLRILEKIWEEEKKVPINLTIEEISFNQDRTRAYSFVGTFDGETLAMHYIFLFWKIGGQWQYRLVYLTFGAVS